MVCTGELQRDARVGYGKHAHLGLSSFVVLNVATNEAGLIGLQPLLRKAVSGRTGKRTVITATHTITFSPSLEGVRNEVLELVCY
jgi:hypothetical protein